MIYLTDNINKGESVDDFSKAFDKVPHVRLMHKLKKCGIGGNVLNWVREWLRDRNQRVKLNGHKSYWNGVKK